MLLDKEVLVKRKNNSNLDYYKSIGYNTDSDYFLVKVEHLLKKSSVIVRVSCDFCNKNEEIPYIKWTRSMESPIKKYSCTECKGEKTKESNLLKYGVTSPAKLESSKEKSKKTNLEKCGVEYHTQSEKTKSKIREKNLEKWGVENPMQHPDIKDKQKNTVRNLYGVDNISELDCVKKQKAETTLKNWGVDSPLKNKEIKDKIKSTNLKKWGVEWISQSILFRSNLKKLNFEKWGVHSFMETELFKKLSKISNLEKWGVDNPSKSDEIKKVKKETLLKNWGVENPMFSDIIKNNIKLNNLEKYGKDHYNKTSLFFKNTKIGNDDNHKEYLGKSYHLFNCPKGHTFSINQLNYHSRNINNTPLCTTCNPIGDLKSIKEKELFQFIESIYNGDIKQSWRDGLEIDIYLPDIKIGFEFNGLYYHSDKFKDKNYHLNKTKHFKERGIRIIHIWEDDWDFKREIVKSQIVNWIGLNKKIFARNCDIREITDKEVIKKFLDKNHIQGATRSNLSIGLYYRDQLLSIMLFDHYEGRKKMNGDEWNINRFCNELGFSIVGGASKLLNYFVKNWKPKRIISYADRDWSIGSLYEKLGFSIINLSKPDYKYIIGGKRVHKSRFRKSRTNINESQLDIPKIWDCGKLKFEINF